MSVSNTYGISWCHKLSFLCVQEIISTRGPKLEFSSGKLARLADGAAVARQGETLLSDNIENKMKFYRHSGGFASSVCKWILFYINIIY